MDHLKISQELLRQNILPSLPIDCQELSGGTVSQLHLLTLGDGSKWVVKQNAPPVIKWEAHFLSHYRNVQFLPNLVFVDPTNHYLVYHFVEGSTHYSRKNKKEVLCSLVKNLINQYKRIENPTGWGWADQPETSWSSFLLEEISHAKKELSGRLPEEDFEFVRGLVEKSRRQASRPFLLHGDCGVHNFLFHGDQLIGGIDPTPIIGEPLYDLVYAFCSSPDELTQETIECAVNQLDISGYDCRSSIYEEVIIGLYLRMRTCLLHHRSDFEAYLLAWKYWKEILRSNRLK